jgi:hypothetical protein
LLKRFIFLALALAVIGAAGPVLDECPLSSDGPAVCAWCACTIVPVALHRPSIAPTLAVAYQLITAPAEAPSYESPLPLPSRAPPAA